ncbi:MAG: alpha/beta fold hydrolase, partial [Bacteriovorax sp.]
LLWRAFFSGGSVTTDPEALVDFISLVPLQLKRWLSDEKKCAFLRHCRVILIGGAPLTPALRMEAQKHGLRLYETYGMSETASLLMVNGEVLPYREVTLDERGHFLVKGRTLSKGHFLKNIFIPHSGEWFKTNDLGRRDKTGRFTFIERADLVFISGGENINPLMIEEIVKENGAIKDAYLVPLKDEKWGEMGLLLYENIEGANQTGRELMAHLKKRLHPYQVPKYVFECKLSFEGQLKAKRSELKQMARELFLKSLFSHDFYPKNNAPVMVFFHGFLGDKEDLKEIAKSLGEHYSLLFVDLPGHGKTKIEHFHSTEDIFYQLASFVRLFDSAPLFYGYSMGGRIALQLSLKYLTPQFLILESAGLGLQSIDEQTRRKQADLELFNGFKDSAEFLKHWYQNPLFDVFRNAKNFKTECKRKSHHEMSEWKTSQLYLSQGCFPLKEENSKSLKEASFPLLYIYGSEDKLYAQNSKEMKESAAVQGAGHNPHKTHPAEIKEILIKKLK